MVVSDDEIRRAYIMPRKELVITLNTRVDPERRSADISSSHQNVDRCAEYGTDLPNVRICPQHRDDRAHSGNGGVGIEWKRSLWREPDLESAREQQLAKRFPHSRRQHHHVEKHRGG